MPPRDRCLWKVASVPSPKLARANCAVYIFTTAHRELGFDDSHTLTLPEFCWWLTRNGLADALPEDAALHVPRMPKPVIRSVTRETELVPRQLLGSEIVEVYVVILPLEQIATVTKQASYLQDFIKQQCLK